MGGTLDVVFIWDIADVSIGAMTIINLFALWLGRHEIKDETSFYFNECSKSDFSVKKVKK